MPSDRVMGPADGLVAVVHDVSVLLHGGCASDALWSLDLPAVAWSEHATTGDVPPPRLFHAGGVFMGSLLICGGEVSTSQLTSGSPSLSYYELDLTTLVWQAVPTAGSVPPDRSHHSATVVQSTLVVVGGRPTLGATRATARAFYDFVSSHHFYEVYLLDIPSRVWRTVSSPSNAPPPPMLWGHSAAAYGVNGVVVYGGMDVAIPRDGVTPIPDPGDPPCASLCAELRVFDLPTTRWATCVPLAHGAMPVARAMHRTVCRATDIHVVGGVTVSSLGEGKTLSDCWRFTGDTREWMRVDLPLRVLPGAAPPVVLYYDQLVLIPSMKEIYFVDLGRRASSSDVQWQRMFTTESEGAWVRRSPFDFQNAAVEPSPLRLHSSHGQGLPLSARDIPSPDEKPRERPLSTLADTSPRRRTVESPRPTHPWASGAFEGGRIVRGPPPREAELAEVAALRAEVERLRRIAAPKAETRRDQSKHVVVHYEPGLTRAAGPTLRDVLHDNSSPGGGRAFVDKLVQEERKEIQWLEKESVEQSARLTSLLLSRSPPKSDLPAALLGYRRYVAQRSAVTSSDPQGSSTTPVVEAPKGGHDERPTRRRVLESPSRELNTDALAMLPSRRRLVVDPAWSPPQGR